MDTVGRKLTELKSALRRETALEKELASLLAAQLLRQVGLDLDLEHDDETYTFV